jgi:transposase-like protein
MPKKTQLTDKERKWVVKQVIRKGRSLGKVGRKLGRNKMTIYKIVKRARDTGEYRKERKEKLTRDDKRSIKALIKKEVSLPSHEIIETLDLKISVSTLCRYLRLKGYNGGTATHPRRILCRADKQREGKDTSKLSEEDKAAIVTLLEEDNTLSSREICDKLDLNVSVSTLCKYLTGAGYVCDAKHLPKRTQ